MSVTDETVKHSAAQGSARTLRTAIGQRGVTEALQSGALPLEGSDWRLDLHDITPLPRAFRMMVNEAAFDVAEMALTTLAMAIEAGRPIIGIPAVLNRDFHYRSIVVSNQSDVRTPTDLVGRRVGVRAYSQTTGVWARGLLADEFGIEAEQVRWVTFESAHVAEYVDPHQVERAPDGASLLGMLEAGELDAAVIMDPRLDAAIARPLFPDAEDRARAVYAATGIYPVNHVLAIDSRVVADLPDLPRQLFDLFVRSRDFYIDRLNAGDVRTPQDEHVLSLAGVVDGHPNPYGLAENARSCDQLLRYAQHQRLLAGRMTARDVFHPSFA